MLLLAAVDSTPSCDVVNRKTCEVIGDFKAKLLFAGFFFFFFFCFNPHEWFQKQKATFLNPSIQASLSTKKKKKKHPCNQYDGE